MGVCMWVCMDGGRAGNLDIDTPALPHAPTVDINRLGTGYQPLTDINFKGFLVDKPRGWYL